MEPWKWGLIIGIVAFVVLLIVISSIFTSWMWLQKRVRKYTARGDKIFTIRVQGFFVQQKKYKLIDLCEQNGYILVEESQEMSSNSNSTGSGMRLGNTPIVMGSSRTTTKTQVTSRVLTFKKK